jgi:DNA-binding SARP family transcriptional activator/DNA-binding CsgD family transcriptional regulator
VQFRILGPLEVLDGQHLVELGRPKQRALLAVLLMHANQVVALDRLVEELWGEEQPAQASASLQAYVSHLRRALEPGRPARTPPRVLVTQPPGYRLVVAPGDIDAARFVALAEEGHRLLEGGRPGPAAQVLLEALGLWRGPALADVADEAFAQAERQRLEELRLAALEDRLAAELALGRHAGSAAELGELVGLHPFRERLHGLLMLALYRAGRQAEALGVFQSARRMLGEELGIDPSPWLRQLEGDILRQAPGLDWTMPAGGVGQPQVEAAGPAVSASATPVPPPADEGELVGREAQLRVVLSGPSAAAFVGREAELAGLDAALNGVLAGTAAGGLVALVAGEAGIGKSALVKRFTERHGADARFLRGTCDPLLTPRALGPLHDIARQTGGRLAELLASGGPREQLFAALLDELDQPARPQVVVIEDAQWADEATLDLLVFLGRRMERTRALLIVSYRDDELAVDHPLRAVVGRLAPETVRHLRLLPLSEAAVAELARRAGRPVAGLRSLTGGNPLLVAEVLAAGEPGVPATVQDLVLARLAGLPADVKKVVRMVAVVPTRTELWLLEEALRPEPTAVERCAEAGLLVIEEEAVGFRHELLRQAVEGSLSALGRRDLHRRVLQVLSDAQERGVDIARLVHHARQADNADAVLRYAPEAARQAAAVAAHREAVGHYRAALRHADRLPPPVRAELLESYSVEAYLSGLSADAVSARQAALDLREAAGDQEQVGEGLRWLSRVSWWAGRRKEAEAAAARAIAVLEGGEPGRQLAMAYSNQAQLDMLAYRRQAALTWASRAIELARRLGDQETLGHALTNIGTTRLLSSDLGGRAELEQAFEVATAAGLEDHAARALVNLAGSGVEMRDFRHAPDDLDRALTFVAEHDLAGYAHYLTGVRARLRLDLGDWAGAEQDARAALAEWEQRRQGGISAVYELVALGLLQARRGDPDAAGTLEEAAARALPTGELRWIGPVAAARAEHAWLHGETDRVAEEAARAFELAVQARHPWFAGELAMRLWQVDTLPEVPAVAAEPYRLLLAGGWRAAADAWQGLGCPYERAQALACGDQDEALLEALGLLDGLGARQTAQRLRRQLRRRGNLRVSRGPTRETTANRAGLTDRQAEVLGLLADGLSNAEIAARLSLSAKTVEHHVSALLAKLGVGSRRQAAAAARHLEVPPAKAGRPGA